MPGKSGDTASFETVISTRIHSSSAQNVLYHEPDM